MVGGHPYEYYALGKHIVSAPGVCRGRPTFKYTRVEVAGVLEWLNIQPYAYGLKKGLFGSSTGAAAALMSAAELPDQVDAVVSRGGRPDLAGASLGDAQAPTLLIVGDNDDVVIDLNKQALDNISMDTEKKLIVVPGASHLFEEPGTLEAAARLARDWFQVHLDRVNVQS